MNELAKGRFDSAEVSELWDNFLGIVPNRVFAFGLAALVQHKECDHHDRE